MDSFRIDEIARRLLERVPPALRSMQQDLESNFRAGLRERLSKLDLVSRDEFDAQTRVLERTRARLEALEARLATLEGNGSAPPHAPGAAPPPGWRSARLTAPRPDRHGCGSGRLPCAGGTERAAGARRSEPREGP